MSKKRNEQEPVSGIVTGRAIPSETRWSAVADALMVGQCYKVETYNHAIGLRGAMNKRGKKCRFEQLAPKRQGAVFVHCVNFERGG